ncbi:DNA polymerase III subunit delta [Listeria floridensis FSL S10-1187]|uniref:DNA polymerase III subunit delta n=1 Tax=Listeria floridensis FSL S10-1187 TaxID=1265817 RepID=A0ABP3B1K3_9LIST|nr:DNA polymerase III subunit delta [Listeria floridensis FSL S10-1187]
MIKEWKNIEQKKLAPVYLIIGVEDYIINQTKEKLLHAALKDEELEFNYANFDLEDTPIEAVIEEAETLPFFGEKRLVIASNPVFLTSEKAKGKLEHRTEKLEQYLNEPVDYSILCFVVHAEKLDERKKLTKLLKKQAVVIEAKRPSEAELLKWIQTEAEQNGFQMEQTAIKRLAELTSGNLTTAMNELSKLMLYQFESKLISVQDVETLVVRSLEQNIFLLIDKIIALDTEGALRVYYDLLKQKEEPIKIIALVASQFRLMNQLRILEQSGTGAQQAAGILKVHPFRAKMAAKQARGFRKEELEFALFHLAETDYELKTGFGEKTQKLEWFLFKLEDFRKTKKGLKFGPFLTNKKHHRVVMFSLIT